MEGRKIGGRRNKIQRSDEKKEGGEKEGVKAGQEHKNGIKPWEKHEIKKKSANGEKVTGGEQRRRGNRKEEGVVD